MFTTRVGDWLTRFLITNAPEQVVSGTLSGEGDLTKEQLTERVASVMADPVKRQFVLDLAPTASQRGDRKAGYHNDLRQFEGIESLALERIGCPTLVVQGSADNDVTPDHSRFAAETIPGAELLMLDTGTHLAFWTHPDAGSAQARALEVLAG